MSPSDPRPLLALVVDDDPGFLALMEDVLSRRGIEADYCTDAESGLRTFMERRHDLLLLDMKMPGMGGLELTQEIRSLPDGHLPLILLITGSGGERTLEAALDSGVDDYLQKPTDPAVLNIRLSIAERRIRDALAQREREAELARHAMVDPLTGLATRALLLERVSSGMKRHQREEDYIFSVLHLDLDAFHRVNEQHGRRFGDQVLLQVAQRLEAAVRSVDTAGHIAADEFGVVLDDLHDASDVTRVTNRIRERFSEPIEIEGQSVFVGASMGIAMSDPRYGTPEEMFRDAAKALRQAKEEGEGSVRIFDPVAHREASARVELENRIREALEADEMVLHYQPIVSLAEPRIVGFEALIRWPDGKGGFVPAGEFVPILERSGFVAHVGWWTLRKAARQLVEWHGRVPTDPPVAVMVNVPGRQFSEPELVPSVVRILNETRLDPEHLHLEITETSTMADLERSVATLHALKTAGIHLHVDDFGTGYSSLSYLHRFPVNALKVDQSFVQAMGERPENLAIIRSVVDLARNLGLEVVAEGIETPEQLAFLREVGCDMGQGWLISKAVPAKEAEAMLRDSTCVLRPLTEGS